MAIPQQQKLYTVSEFEDFIARLENADRRFELINGEIVEKVPTQRHGVITVNISSELKQYVKRTGHGRVAFEVRHQLPGDEQNAPLPDVEYYVDASQPSIDEGAVPHMPDLCVEVQSPKDQPKEMRDKADYYLANGTKQVRHLPRRRHTARRRPAAGVRAAGERYFRGLKGKGERRKWKANPFSDMPSQNLTFYFCLFPFESQKSLAQRCTRLFAVDRI
jgi:hypothetical protein